MPATAYVSNDVNSYIAFGSQSAQGTESSTYTFAKYLDGAGLEHARTVTSEREGGTGQDLVLAYTEHHVGGAQVPVYARPEITARILAYALGQGTRTSTASTHPYTHELYPVDQARMLTYEQFSPGAELGERMLDSKITEVSIEGEHGKPVKVTANIVGGDSPQNRDAGSARTITLESDDPFYFNTASHQVAVGGAYQADDGITKWKVTFSRGVDDAVFGAGYGRKAIPEQNREVAVELTRRYTNATVHRQIAYGGGSYVSPTVATGAFKVFMTNGNTGSALRSFELEVPLMVMEVAKRNGFEVDGQTVYEDLVGKGLKGATHVVRAQIKNLVPTHLASGLL